MVMASSAAAASTTGDWRTLSGGCTPPFRAVGNGRVVVLLPLPIATQPLFQAIPPRHRVCEGALAFDEGDYKPQSVILVTLTFAVLFLLFCV
jgi:hypothetical protein